MPQSTQILDASALLAAIQQESGAEMVQKVTHHSMISTVICSEVIQKLSQAGVDTENITHALMALGLNIIDFTQEDADFAQNYGLNAKLLDYPLPIEPVWQRL